MYAIGTVRFFEIGAEYSKGFHLERAVLRELPKRNGGAAPFLPRPNKNGNWAVFSGRIRMLLLASVQMFLQLVSLFLVSAGSGDEREFFVFVFLN